MISPPLAGSASALWVLAWPTCVPQSHVSTPLSSTFQSLSSQGFLVKAFDVYAPSLAACVKAGCASTASPREAAAGVQVLALMVVNAAQVEDALFGAGGVAEGEGLESAQS